MSFDLVLWSGSTAAPTRLWNECITGSTVEGMGALPRERLIAAFEKHDDVRVRGAVVEGRGWECEIAGTYATIRCAWELADEPASMLRIVRAAHAAGCSVYDAQYGGYWPASAGVVPEPEGWAAVFDEGWVFEDEDDEVGGPAGEPVRLCPEYVFPTRREVGLYIHVTERAEGHNAGALTTLVGTRAKLHRARFPNATIAVEFGGPAAHAVLEHDNVALWLKGSDASPRLSSRAKRPSVAFSVLGDFEAGDLVERLDVCPFELVPLSAEQRWLAQTFGEPVAALHVVVPAHVAVVAPDSLRVAVQLLRDASTDLNGAPVQFADPSKVAAPISANVAWVEALVGLDATSAGPR